MAEILLTHSYFLRFDSKQWKAQQPYPPLATLYAASALQNNNFQVAFHDTMFAKSADEIKQSLQKYQPKIFVIYDDGFNYLTKMCLTNMREAAFKMIEIAKSFGCKIIVSSSDSTDHADDYLKHGADYIIIGEGEQTLIELSSLLLRSNTIENEIDGLAFLRNGNILRTKKRENLRELDSLSLPAWDLLNADEYKNAWTNSAGYFSLNMTTTRGCPFKCNWCAKPIYGNRYNSRSPENVVKELKLLKQKFNFEHIWFCDDIFGLKPDWVNRFADLVEKEKLKFRFKIQSRVDLLLEENTIEALARAGCDEVWVGAESGSQKILDAMDKGTQVKQIYEATKLLKSHHIKPCFFLQFGYLGETKEDIEATTNMLFELMPHDIGISVSYPLPGTKFYEKVKTDLQEKTNWTDSDELAMLFKSTYPADFYKKLQRYVHHEFRKRQSLAALQNFNIKNLIKLSYRIPQSIFSKRVLRKYVG